MKVIDWLLLKWHNHQRRIAVLASLAYLIFSAGYGIAGLRHVALGSACKALVVGIAAFLPPLFFSIEYLAMEREAVRDPVTTLYTATAKEDLDRLKQYQDNLSKIWLALAAAIAFLYYGDYSKKPETYICKPSPSSPPAYVCSVKPDGG